MPITDQLKPLVFSLAFIVCAYSANAQSLSDLQSQASTFHDEAKALYRLDAEDLDRIWEAYCGELDPYSAEDKEFAAKIGEQLQNKEKGILEQLLNSEGPELKEAANKLMEGPDSSEAKQILNDAEKELDNLNRLNDGAVLKGANHPFVQYAIEYGIKRHEEMCGEFGDDPKVCDKNFDGVEGRPDLVTVEHGHLVIYEFKPDNSRAKDKGEKQLEKYLPGVVTYYQKYFEDGRNAGFKGEPDSDHGGIKFLQALKASKDAWSSDGTLLQAIPNLGTYTMCEKRFGD